MGISPQPISAMDAKRSRFSFLRPTSISIYKVYWPAICFRILNLNIGPTQSIKVYSPDLFLVMLNFSFITTGSCSRSDSVIFSVILTILVSIFQNGASSFKFHSKLVIYELPIIVSPNTSSILSWVH